MAAECLEEVPLPDPGLPAGLETPLEPPPVAGVGHGDAAYAAVVEHPRVHDDVCLRGGLGQGMVSAEGEDESSLRDVLVGL